MTKLYLSGPMSGHPNFNFEAFELVSQALRDSGFVVLNPAETAGGEQNLPKPWYMEMDFAAIRCSDGVVFLPGWQDSTGSFQEMVVACALDKPCYEIVPQTGHGYDLRELVGIRVHGFIDYATEPRIPQEVMDATS